MVVSNSVVIKHYGFIAADTDDYYAVEAEKARNRFTFDPLLTDSGFKIIFDGTLEACKAFCEEEGLEYTLD
jgi:hypothetical protein